MNDIPKATPTFSRSTNTAGLVWTLSNIGVSGKLKMTTITGSTYDITHYLSFYTLSVFGIEFIQFWLIKLLPPSLYKAKEPILIEIS